jgi:surface antigen/peptidoglycan hydrolase CwlO-like protein
MKRLSTIPAQNIKHTAKKVAIITVTIVFAATMPFQLAHIVRADNFDDQIAQLQTQIDSYQQQAAQLNSQADTLQKTLDQLDSQKNAIEAQMNLQQVQLAQLNQDIANNQQKISDDQDALGNTIADLYLADQESPLEILASSTSIADYVDKQTYQNSVKDSLATTITSIKNTKLQLEKQKQAVEQVIAEQQFAHDALVAKENEQSQLIAQTKGQESAYESLIATTESQKLSTQQAQQDAIQTAIERDGGVVDILPGDPNKGGYPWEAGCWVDANAVSHGGVGGNGTDALGYGCRQCVSYAAWRVGQYTGHFPMYWGNANQWPASAQAAGYTTGTTPRIDSVGIISAGAYGHVVWIEAVNNDGTVDVSQYNYFDAGGPGWGNYSKMRVPASTYDTYIYF